MLSVNDASVPDQAACGNRCRSRSNGPRSPIARSTGLHLLIRPSVCPSPSACVNPTRPLAPRSARRPPIRSPSLGRDARGLRQPSGWHTPTPQDGPSSNRPHEWRPAPREAIRCHECRRCAHRRRWWPATRPLPGCLHHKGDSQWLKSPHHRHPARRRAGCAS